MDRGADGRPLAGLLLDLSYTLLTNGRTESFHEGLAALGRRLSPGEVHELLGRADAEFARRFPDRQGYPVHLWVDDYAETVADLLPGRPADARERTVLRAATRPWAEAGANWRLYDDVVPFLTQLRARGLKLALVSNWGATGHRVVRELGLDERVDAVVLSEDVRAAKPDPAIFEAALRSLGVGVDEAAMVGDNYAQDILGAARAGLRGILLDRYGLGRLAEAPCPLARSLKGVAWAALAPELHLPPPGAPARRPAVPEAVPSASVVVLRDGPAGLEVLLGLRAEGRVMPLVAAFPGGRLSASDGDPGQDETYRRAALRETFEETGIWLGPGERPGDDERSALLRGRPAPSLARLAARDLAALVPIGWLETPPHLAARFHTRFFLAGLPPGARPEPHRRELVELAWWRPQDALEGGLPLMKPTRAALAALAPFATAQEALAAARAAASPWLTPRATFPVLP
ncbi:MAG: HAD-IA family hydrolase [Clostridia bacterium]|nr:HAD-IA family hydrolase [Clostridia bacterium]